jgi:hypothetical protein
MYWLIAFVILAVAVVAAVAWLRRPARTLRCRNGAIYYQSPVTKEEAHKLREFLEWLDLLGPSLPAVAVEKEKETYRFRLPTAPANPQDEELQAKCAVIAAGLADEVFAGVPVEVHVCGNWWLTLAVVPSCGRYGERLRCNSAELFFTSGVTEDDAIRLSTYLAGKGFFNDRRKLGQLNRTADGFELRLEVNSESELGPAHREEFLRMASDLGRDVFGLPVQVVLCEGVRKTLHNQVLDPKARPASRRHRVILTETYTYPVRRITEDWRIGFVNDSFRWRQEGDDHVFERPGQTVRVELHGHGMIPGAGNGPAESKHDAIRHIKSQAPAGHRQLVDREEARIHRYAYLLVEDTGQDRRYVVQAFAVVPGQYLHLTLSFDKPDRQPWAEAVATSPQFGSSSTDRMSC